MKSRVLWLCTIFSVTTVVAFSQQPTPQPGPPSQGQQPGPHAPWVDSTQHPPAGQHPPAQPARRFPPTHPHDPIAGNLFPPECVMQHRRELGLTDEQKAAIRDETLKASTRFTELQWQMQDEMETMATLMKSSPVDEQRALAQLDKVLNIEREVKRTQLGLSIRIRNKLTSEQQTKLQELHHNPHPPKRVQ
jgi:Spy/CpxP family protein refolding chaperone